MSKAWLLSGTWGTMAACLILLLLGLTGSALAQDQASDVREKGASEKATSSRPVTVTGVIDIVWLDPPRNSNGEPGIEYTLTDERGRKTELLPDEGVPILPPGLDPIDLKGKKVEVTGTGETGDQLQVQSVEVAQDTQRAASAVEAQAAVTGSQPTATILCRWGDATGVTPRPKSYFETYMGGSYPGMDHYWREVSYDNINLTGSQVYGWYNLPQPKSYYHNSDGSVDTGRLVSGCTAAADADVVFTNFENINMVFNQQWDDPLYAAKGGWTDRTLDGQRKTWGFTLLPPEDLDGNSYYNHETWAHEFGHAFGLAHSLGYGQDYGNDWDLMSGNGACRDLTLEYVCKAQHPISYNKDKLGWVPSSRKYRASQGPNQSITLQRLAQPPTSGYLMAHVPINGSTNQYYTVEARRFAGYDNEVPSEAIAIHKIDRLKGLGIDVTGQKVAEVVDGDGNGNANDSGSAWVPGETFTDSANGISIAITAQTATGYSVRVSTPTTLPPDSAAPKVLLATNYGTNPVIAGGTSFPFAAYAMDDRGPLDRLQFLVDGSVVGNGEALDPEATAFAYYWNSTTVRDGRSTVAARAFDTAGNATTSTGFQFIVDNFWPQTTIASGPVEGSFSRDTSADFRFASDDRNPTFRCKLDAGAWAPCVPGKTYTGLANGRHTFSVYTVGSAGEANDSDSSPAVRTWTVDAIRPTGRVLVNNGAASTRTKTVSLKLSATDPAPASGVALMRFSNDGRTWSAWQAYTTSKRWTLAGAAGTKIVYAQYRDRAGNISAVARDTIRYSP